MDNTMEQKGQHTPGPWVNGHFEELDDEIVIQTCEGEYVASIDCDGAYDGQIAQSIDANARLIAAAPDMLAALEDAERALEMLGFPYYRNSRMNIRAAIAKAKGTTL